MLLVYDRLYTYKDGPRTERVKFGLSFGLNVLSGYRLF